MTRGYFSTGSVARAGPLQLTPMACMKSVSFCMRAQAGQQYDSGAKAVVQKHS